jgi:zinc protease
MRATLRQVAESGVTELELARARRRVVAAEAFGRDGPMAVVSQLNEAIAVGDWTLYPTARERVETVTAADVAEAARRVFHDDRLTVGHYVPTSV